jgi:mannose/fructose/N-acetylgalactosamine-specific phosphotransferase system component IIC
MATSDASRAEVEKAYAEASRAASRSSLMGALGFGVALVMGITLAREGSPFAAGFGLELILAVGGMGGGIVFTVLALRASRMAKECQRRLREMRKPKRR